MERKVPPETLMLNVSSTGNAFPATIDGFSPVKPCQEHGDQKANKGLAGEYEDEVDSWLSLDFDSDGDRDNNGYSCGEVDCGLDLKGCNSCFKNQCQVVYNPQQYHGVCQGNTASERLESFPFAGAWERQQEQQYWRNLGMECESVNMKAEAQFLHSPLRSQSVSALYMDDGVLREATMSNVSDSYGRNSGWQFGTHSSTTLKMPPNFAPMNREAKVQRYREKRRKRNFEKTIRYASRQAYAETRPRVRGKFAREAEKEEIELHQMFSMDKNLPRNCPPF